MQIVQDNEHKRMMRKIKLRSFFKACFQNDTTPTGYLKKKKK